MSISRAHHNHKQLTFINIVKGKMFYLKEKINKKNYIFKVDTDLDVTLIREGLY